ncbi:hypothetical protein AB0I37_08540 [Micromonospora purpureochromogenes]
MSGSGLELRQELSTRWAATVTERAVDSLVGLAPRHGNPPAVDPDAPAA